MEAAAQVSDKQVALDAQAQLKARKRMGRRSYLLLAALVGTSLLGYAVYRWATWGIEETDDARIEADVVPLSARVGGQIIRVVVRDNQTVKQGELILEIERIDYQARVQQAEAELEVARTDAAAAEADVQITGATSSGGLSSAWATVSTSKLGVQSADAQVSAAEAARERAEVELRKKELDLERAQRLAAEKAIPQVQLEDARTAADTARARLHEAEAQLGAAREQSQVARARVSEAQGRLEQSEPVKAQVRRSAARLELARARVKSSEAALSLARIALERTRVVAPATGMLTRLAVHPGQLVQAGQLLVNFVPQKRYVVANFKETQVGKMRAGQDVTVEIDAYPGREFPALVDSIMPGTGARFSLLPADNATGNFVKVVQRVPVYIAWKGEQPPVRLEPGLSAIVKVHVR